MSLPSRGAWIEISDPASRPLGYAGRSPHGERGLKSYSPAAKNRILCRSPHGERGLKSPSPASPGGGGWSLPSRGAWIEIAQSAKTAAAAAVAPLTGSVD